MAMTEFQRQILQRLETEHAIDADFVGDSIAQVIRGEKTEEWEERAGNGNMIVTKRKRTRAPVDVLAGLAVLDTVMGGEIHAKEAMRRVGVARAQLYGQYVPQIPGGSITDVVFHEDDREKQLVELDDNLDDNADEGNTDDI